MDSLKLPSQFTIGWLFLFIFFIIINRSFSARILHDSPLTHDLAQPSIAFYMSDILGQKHHLSSKPVTPKVHDNQQLIPFPKPLGIFPPIRGIPLPNSNAADPTKGFSAQTLDFPGIGISFPARATLEEMEFGAVTVIDEALFEGAFGSVFIGKAEGMYVASSEDGSSHMMAITVSFANDENEDGLRLFGLYRRDVSESHVAVIGGTGKYQNANGYATIKTMNVNSNIGEMESKGIYRVLSCNVYLG